MCWRRCNNARCDGLQPAQAAKISQKRRQVSGLAKGRADVQQLQAFHGSNACQTVDGTVSPNGWCMIYQKA